MQFLHLAARRAPKLWRCMPFLLCVLCVACKQERAIPLPQTPPNIVIIVSDDQGWADVGLNSDEILTPRFDQLVSEGALLEHFYTQPVCSPTRIGLLTGRYPIHFGLMHSVIRVWDQVGLATSSLTLPELLVDAGYGARGAIGKWHLGHTSFAAHHPLSHGFTSFYGAYSGALDYFTQLRHGERDWHRDNASAPETAYVTDMIGDEAVSFIETHAEERFFLYVAFTAPHTPLAAPQELIDQFASITDPTRRTFAAMIASLDQNVGKILDALDEQSLADDTLVWFLSDNGGDLENGGSNSPLTGAKSTLYQGGIRTFSSVRFPGFIPAGAKLAMPIAYIDIVPTLLFALKQEIPENIDGRNVWSSLVASKAGSNRKLFFYNEMFDAENGAHEEQSAIIDWPLKWLRIEDKQTLETTTQLFDLNLDPLEEAPFMDEAIELEMSLSMNEFLSDQPAHLVDPTETLPPDFTPRTDWQMLP